MTGLIDKLPYELTGAQKRAIDEIVADMESPFCYAKTYTGEMSDPERLS